MKNSIKAVIFDLDGVLVETRHCHFKALENALKNVNISLTFEEHKIKFDGLPTYKKIEMLSEMYSLSEAQAKFLNSEKQRHTVELLEGTIFPELKHTEMMNYLSSQDIKIAICSNTRRETLDYIIEKLQINDFLSFTLSSDDVVNPKPDSEIYLMAMKLLGLKNNEIVAFEDSPHGINAAKGANLLVCHINSPDDLTLNLVKKCLMQ